MEQGSCSPQGEVLWSPWPGGVQKRQVCEPEGLRGVPVFRLDGLKMKYFSYGETSVYSQVTESNL